MKYTLFLIFILLQGCASIDPYIKNLLPAKSAQQESETSSDAQETADSQNKKSASLASQKDSTQKNNGDSNITPTEKELIFDDNGEAIEDDETLFELNTAAVNRDLVIDTSNFEDYDDLWVDSNDGAVPTGVWERVRDNFKMDLSLDNARLRKQVKWYGRHQRYMDRIIKRARRYMYYVIEQIEARGMPGELALLPIIESAFDPFAYSHSRASGLWQFIPSTGTVFGLQQDWWQDQRRDVRLSTVAALDYLQQLSDRFDGDWLLALAAYNTGAGNVSKSIRRNKKLGKPTDYWSLDLPAETEAYVPKLLAIAKLLKDPEYYGIYFRTIPNQPYFAVANLNSQIDMAQAASLAGIPIEEMYQLNPALNRWATSPNGPHQLLIPIESKKTFEEKLSKLPPENWIQWQRYKVKSGDTLGNIAQRHHTTLSVLSKVNPIRNNVIHVGDVLLIPTSTLAGKSYSLQNNKRLKAAIDKMDQINKGKRARIDYVVKKGDTFWELSNKFHVGVQEITRWNGLGANDVLQNGMKLVIWANPKIAKRISDSRKVIRKIGYRVREGDSLSGIAGKFNVSVGEIKRWNPKDTKDFLQPGAKLTLFVDVTRGK